jgi:hypothetical protein
MSFGVVTGEEARVERLSSHSFGVVHLPCVDFVQFLIWRPRECVGLV